MQLLSSTAVLSDYNDIILFLYAYFAYKTTAGTSYVLLFKIFFQQCLPVLVRIKPYQEMFIFLFSIVLDVSTSSLMK